MRKGDKSILFLVGYVLVMVALCCGAWSMMGKDDGTRQPSTMFPSPAPTSNGPAAPSDEAPPAQEPTVDNPGDTDIDVDVDVDSHVGRTVTGGAFCSPPGSIGRTRAGTRMRCSKARGGRYRWTRV